MMTDSGTGSSILSSAFLHTLARYDMIWYEYDNDYLRFGLVCSIWANGGYFKNQQYVVLFCSVLLFSVLLLLMNGHQSIELPIIFWQSEGDPTPFLSFLFISCFIFILLYRFFLHCLFVFAHINSSQLNSTLLNSISVSWHE